MKKLLQYIFLLVTAGSGGMLLAGKDAAPANLLKNGGFEIINPKLKISHGGTGYVADWTPLFYPAQGFKAGVSNDAASGKHSVYLENHLGKKSLTWLSGFIPAVKGEKLVVSFSIRTDKLQAGKGWHKPGVMIIFYDKNKQRVAHRDVKRFGAEIAKWTKVTGNFAVPNKDKIAFMRVGLVISYCRGKVFFDDVSLMRKVKKELKVSFSSPTDIFPQPKIVKSRHGTIMVSEVAVNWGNLPDSPGRAVMNELLSGLKKNCVRNSFST